MSDRRSRSKARRAKSIRHYGVFAHEASMAGMLEALGFLILIEPEHEDTASAWQAFTDALLSSYETEGDMSQLVLPRCANIRQD